MTKSSKEIVAAAAIDLFAHKGYRETTVGDIEAAAGLTPRAGGFYRHFRSKDAVLAESLARMAGELVAEIRLEDVLQQKTVRAELLFIAGKLIAHSREHRSLRLLLQREAHKLPALRAKMQEANLVLARQDIVPWTAHALKRAGRRRVDPRTFAFVVFGPVILYIISQDRNQPAFGLSEEAAIEAWAAFWAEQLKVRRKRATAESSINRRSSGP